jgi:hypothetical protein
LPHCLCSNSKSGRGGDARALDKDIPDDEDALEEIVFARERPVEDVTLSSPGMGMGIESISS